MPPEPPPARRDRLPPFLLPLLYFGVAHLALAVAFAALALAPEKYIGFFYHPRMVFVVHLVTLGWITSSILGALHLVGPMALATPMPARRLDYVTFALYVAGASGVIFHFWIDELSGVALSGIPVIFAVVRTGAKLLSSASPRVPVAVRAHFFLAFANFALAALYGMLLAVDKIVPVLPGYRMAQVYAHAHLAALGWATMMVFAAGYRLLPMLLPSAMPRGASVWVGAVALEAGVLGLFATLLLESSWRGFFALLTVAGIAAFLLQLAWMKRHRRPAPKALPRPDWGVAQVLQALAYLAAAAIIGLVLVWQPTTPLTLRLAVVYGVFGLVGFLAQMVVGISTRLLPIFSWLTAYSAAGFEPPPASPHVLADRRLQVSVFFLWSAGVPALAAGFFLESSPLVTLGGWLLAAAVLATAASHWVVLRALRGSGPSAR